jgi:vitamin B12 transport system substrate-binding protein
MADRVSLRALGLFVCLLGTSLCAMATPPQRIVSLTPHLTELLFDIGAGDRGRHRRCLRLPRRGGQPPRVANYRSINLEALLARSRIW